MGAGRTRPATTPDDVRTWRLPADLESVRVARLATLDHVAEMPAADVDPDDLELIVSELVTNAIEHGAGDDVVVTVRSGPQGAVEVTVANAVDGDPYVPTDLMLPGPDEVKGRGLAISGALSESLRVVRRPGTVEVTVVVGSRLP